MQSRLNLATAVAAAALALTGCGRSEPETPRAQAAPAAGRLTVQVQTVADLKPAPATLTTRDMAEARARIPGVLVSLNVKEGDIVRQGQVIARIQDDRLNLETSAFDAQVRAAAAEAERAQADLARTQDLYEHGVYAKARLEQVQAQARAASAALAAARAQRGASAELAGQGAIVAPAAGRVLSADVPVGSVVMPGQTIARITAGPPVVRLELPEADAAALKVGDTVRLSAEDLPGVGGQGTIAQVYPAVTGGQVMADVTAPNLPQDRVGQRVRASVKIGERKAIVVPRRYVATRFGVDYVRLVRTDGTLSETPIQTAPGPAADSVEVLSGLRAGDVVSPAAAR
jgi:RND family efflux transporter MFP subunit